MVVWNFTTLNIYSVQTSGGPRTSRPTGWRGTCTGRIIPECTGSATTLHTGADSDIPSTWDKWGVLTAPGSSQTLMGNHLPLLLTLYEGKWPLRVLTITGSNVYNFLQPPHRMVYWTVIGDHSHIEEAAMDGSLRRILLERNLRRPTGEVLTCQSSFWKCSLM